MINLTIPVSGTGGVEAGATDAGALDTGALDPTFWNRFLVTGLSSKNSGGGLRTGLNSYSDWKMFESESSRTIFWLKEFLPEISGDFFATFELWSDPVTGL